MGYSGVILIIVIIFILWCYYWCFSHPTLETKSLNELLAKNQFKTGDIILFKAVDNFNAPFIMSYYGHVGIVYVRDNIPFIFEAANPTEMTLDGNQNTKGIYVSSLEDRIKRYKGYTFHKKLEKLVDAETCKEFETFMEYCIGNMEYETNIVYNGIKKGMGEKIGIKINCGEIVFLSLIKLGLLPISMYENRCFHHLRLVCGVADLKNNRYLDPIKITYSPIAQDPQKLPLNALLRTRTNYF